MTARLPSMTREQELDLITRAKAGDREARDMFIRANMKYADYYAMKMSKRSHSDIDDLKSEAYIGLLDAFDRFDVTSGYRFMSYAMHWMKCHVLKWLRETRGMVHIPQTSTHVQVADRRLDALLHDSEFTWLDLLESPDVDPEMDLLEKERMAHTRARGKTLLKELDARERLIIEARCMREAEDTPTLREIGEVTLGVSHERVRQIEAQALRKMTIAMRKQRAA